MGRNRGPVSSGRGRQRIADSQAGFEPREKSKYRNEVNSSEVEDPGVRENAPECFSVNAVFFPQLLQGVLLESRLDTVEDIKDALLLWS